MLYHVNKMIPMKARMHGIIKHDLLKIKLNYKVMEETIRFQLEMAHLSIEWRIT